MIDRDATLLAITEKNPETIPVFVSNGFPHMADPAKRVALGKSISLSTALLLKQLNEDSFVALLEEAIQREADTTDLTLAKGGKKAAAEGPRVVGLLPCPVRLPLMEKWNAFLSERRKEGKAEIQHDLRSASMGLDWVKENLSETTEKEELPDIFLSAGFDLFFDEAKIGRFRRAGLFADPLAKAGENPDFAGLQLKDPEGYYSIISAVPAIFLVNGDELNGRPAPASWKDLLDPQFENSVSIPVGDFDLFNAILLNIQKSYGDDGVTALGRSLLESMHPSQMVKSERLTSNKPAVTIMPYFFSKMVKPGSALKAVWPEDGALLSPVFMLAKASDSPDISAAAEFFASKEVGEVLAHQGLFPSTHPEVDNRLPEGSRFMWLGWDYIVKHDLSALIDHCMNTFHGTAEATA